MAQQMRELTAEEIAEGNRGISDQKMSATQIQALVRNMDQSKKKWGRLRTRDRAQYLEHLKEENEKLYFNFPGIFDMHAEDRLDQTFFEMLSLKRKIEKGELTTDQASAIVGQQMFQKYVPHVISNAAPPAPAMSYEDYYRQFGSNN
jgi:uncharacterized short protein YbdD (DUF466 family)